MERLLSGSSVNLIRRSEARRKRSAWRSGRSMLFVELAQLADESRLAKLLRDSQLWQAILVVQSGELAAQEADAPHLRQLETLLWNRLRDFKEPVLLLGPPTAFLQVPQEVTLWRVEVEAPDFEARRKAWTFGARQGRDRIGNVTACGYVSIRPASDPPDGQSRLRSCRAS